MRDKWIYSKEEDLYWEYSEEFDTKEDAIEAAKQDDEIEKNVFVGRKVPAIIQGIDIDSLLEEISENATLGLDEGCGEDFLMNVSKKHIDELEENLNKVFFDWMAKYNYSPDWVLIEDIELIEL